VNGSALKVALKDFYIYLPSRFNDIPDRDIEAINNGSYYLVRKSGYGALQYNLVEKVEDVTYEDLEGAILSGVENPVLSQPYITQDMNFLTFGKTMTNQNQTKKQKK